MFFRLQSDGSSRLRWPAAFLCLLLLLASFHLFHPAGQDFGRAGQLAGTAGHCNLCAALQSLTPILLFLLSILVLLARPEFRTVAVRAHRQNSAFSLFVRPPPAC